MNKIVSMAAREVDHVASRNELFDYLCQILMVKIADWDNNNYFNLIKDDPKETWLRFRKCRLNYKLTTQHLGMFQDFKISRETTLKVMGILEDIDFDTCNYDPFSKLWQECITYHGKKSSLGQFHTPYHVVKMMVEMNIGDAKKEDAPLKLIDPTCGVGTMQTIAWRTYPELFDPMHSIYGVDIDFISVLGARYSFAAWGLNPHNVVCGDGLERFEVLWEEHQKKLVEKMQEVDRQAILEEIEEINDKLISSGYSLNGKELVNNA